MELPSLDNLPGLDENEEEMSILETLQLASVVRSSDQAHPSSAMEQQQPELQPEPPQPEPPQPEPPQPEPSQENLAHDHQVPSLEQQQQPTTSTDVSSSSGNMYMNTLEDRIERKLNRLEKLRNLYQNQLEEMMMERIYRSKEFVPEQFELVKSLTNYIDKSNMIETFGSVENYLVTFKNKTVQDLNVNLDKDISVLKEKIENVENNIEKYTKVRDLHTTLTSNVLKLKTHLVKFSSKMSKYNQTEKCLLRSSSSLSKFIYNLTECPVCLDGCSFGDIIWYQCGHFVCIVCMKKFINMETHIKCPICRTSSKQFNALIKRTGEPGGFTYPKTLNGLFDLVQWLGAREKQSSSSNIRASEIGEMVENIL